MEKTTYNSAQIIEAIRRKEGLNRKKLAELLGVSTVTIWSWETGRSSPNVNMLMKLCKLTGREIIIKKKYTPEMGQKNG